MARRKKTSPPAYKSSLPPSLFAPNIPVPGERIMEFTDADGRKLQAGDTIRVKSEPQSWRYKIRHLFRTPTGKAWIEAYGPFNHRGEISTNSESRVPKYRSFPLDGVSAKCRPNDLD